MADCIFCKIARGEIPCAKLYEDDHVLSFLDIQPINPGHALVIPKRHYATLFEIPDQELAACIGAAKKVAAAVHKAVGAAGLDPTTAAFRLKSPEMCARCHTDPERMQKYGLSTQVLNTYVADFHGTTVTLFEKLSPDAETNKPVCYDCHGFHVILHVSDPEKGISVRENLLARCQRCHPDASADFPDAWLSHYIPSPDRYPLVFSVDLFYKILIPGTLGGMGLLVILDFSSKVRLRMRRRKPTEPVAAEVPTISPGPEPAGPGSSSEGGEETQMAEPRPVSADPKQFVRFDIGG